MNITMALYCASREIEPVEILTVLSIHWCTCEINSYKIMILTPYSVTKLFEFQEGYITSAMVSVDMHEILHVLYVEVVGNSFVQCISYHNCCVYLDCSTLRPYSAYLESNRPISTDSFVWGPVLMDLEYLDNHRRSQLVSFHYVHRLLNPVSRSFLRTLYSC